MDRMGLLCFALLMGGCAGGEVVEFVNGTTTTHIYRRIDGQDLTLQVTPAVGGPVDAKRPAMIFFPVGGFKVNKPDQFKLHSEYLRHRGMTTVMVTCRVGPGEDGGPEQTVDDGRSAIRWVRDHAEQLGIDPRRIVASGGSAGAVVALCAGVMEPPASRDEPDGNSRPDALVLFNPAVTYMPIDGREYRSEQRLTLYRQRWGRSDLPEISAYQQVDRNAPPTIILHGEEDAICPIATIRLFADKMTRCGVRCDLVVYPGQGHGFFNASRDRGAYFLKTMREVDRFLVSLGYLCGDGDVDNWLSGRTGAVPPT